MSRTISFVLKAQGKSILVKKMVYGGTKKTKHVAIMNGKVHTISKKRYDVAQRMYNEQA